MWMLKPLTVAAFAGPSRHLPISPIHFASNGCWVWLVAARTETGHTKTWTSPSDGPVKLKQVLKRVGDKGVRRRKKKRAQQSWW